MKKMLALLLLMATLLPSIALVACNTPKPDTDNEGNDDYTGTPIIHPDKYAPFELSEEKIQGAIDEAIDRINKKMVGTFITTFPAHNSTNNVYTATNNDSGWNQGFYTGMLWHAYELTGTDGYRN